MINDRTKYAVVGIGHMGAPIASALALSPGAEITLFNRTAAKAVAVAAGHTNMSVAASAAEAVVGARIVVLAVKPYLLRDVLRDCLNAAPSATYVSLAPGISLNDLEAIGAASVVRLMPNVAIAHGEGMSFICHNKAAAADALLLAQALAPTGHVDFVEERLFEPCMAVASCGIAYALRYVRATAQAAVSKGLRPDDATAFAAQTLRGVAAMLEANPGVNPESLIDTVTTPGGSTIRGLMAMEREGFTPAVAAGILGCL
ncbi:MAG: NAD(P)-binding domain-containing protein [Muribaculaceae bacterium]|nr:NAD(P)-binding domain-containing protein [Muribaculaceae bacterium]